MKYRLPLLMAVLITLTITVSLAGQTKPAAAKPWAAPKTPWGDPDLQGTWTSDDCIGTPMNRAANLGEKRYWTEAELAQRESTLARQAENDKQELVAAD